MAAGVPEWIRERHRHDFQCRHHRGLKRCPGAPSAPLAQGPAPRGPVLAGLNGTQDLGIGAFWAQSSFFLPAE